MFGKRNAEQQLALTALPHSTAFTRRMTAGRQWLEF